MSLFFKFRFIAIFLFSCIFYCEYIHSMMEDEACGSFSQRGKALYEDGKYEDATVLLRKALEEEDYSAAAPFGDICLRNLDNGKHTFHEAAVWYIKAALYGDTDVASYLYSLSPDLLQDTPEAEKVQILSSLWAHQEASHGFNLYVEGNFREAAKPLKRAAAANHCLAQQLYGDICLRRLDDKPHSYHEAAMWYLLSARGGDPQSLSYLSSFIPNVLRSTNYEQQMAAIVSRWVLAEEVPALKSIKPGQINDYIVFQYGRRINKTTAQKLPYLFERIVTGIMFALTGRVQSVVDERMVPTAGSSGLNETFSGRTFEDGGFIRAPVTACVYGPVYMTYFRSLDRLLEGGVLKTPPNCPDICPVYSLLLDCLHEQTRDMRASCLSQLSHRDYPWLLAGIRYWKEYTGRSFTFTSLTESELIRRLESCRETIDERDIAVIRQKVERKEIWPNQHQHPNSQEFNHRMHHYFTTDLSRQEPLVQRVEEDFCNRLRTVEIDCSSPRGIATLRSSLLMVYCQRLVLRTLHSNTTCSAALEAVERVLINPVITIFFSNNFKERSATGSRIMKVLLRLRKRGIAINMADTEVSG